MLQDGLYDQDQYCRKISMALLKGNLKSLGNESLYASIFTTAEFELHWTTFFDLYDTLESFGTHLTKVNNYYSLITLFHLGCLGTLRTFLRLHS